MFSNTVKSLVANSATIKSLLPSLSMSTTSSAVPEIPIGISAAEKEIPVVLVFEVFVYKVIFFRAAVTVTMSRSSSPLKSATLGVLIYLLSEATGLIGFILKFSCPGLRYSSSKPIQNQ